ncbi:LysR family transcriptional regulator [Dinoroseobacter sp. S375]|uniref:LysR family transcriptional regulator n=1 Tax=Dinoroseobacter sp. S375 TaxID=3415136 RepID=UPI003C7D4F01
MRRLKLDHLQTFLAVAQYRTVSKAADALNLTQPAVTSRIKALEETLGTALFERNAKGMRLTQRGDLLVHYAQQFQHLSNLVEERVVDAHAVEQLLRLGVSETIAQSWLPDFVGALRATYPRLKIEISVDISLNLRQQLMGREIDLAILLGPISEYTVDNTVLPDVPLAWFRAPGEDPDPAAPVDLSRIPIATYAKNTRPYRELRAAMFERFGPEVSLFPSSSLSSCFRLVEAGLCVGALPMSLADRSVAAGRLVQFDPGWVPAPLQFSASYLSEPRNHLVESAATIAREISLQEA